MKKTISLILCLVMLTGSVHIFAAADERVQNALTATAGYISALVKDPQIASVGGEWSVIGLARSGIHIDPSFFDRYYANVETLVKKNQGVIEDRKFTEYSRVIMALTATGKTPEDVAGYNLLLPLADYDKTVWQGVNGAIWALIALDCGNYEIPSAPGGSVQATRDMYIQFILDSQKSDGGFALGTSSVSDADTTAMAIVSLKNYRHRKDVEEAIQKALLWLTDNQKDDGGFESFGVQTSESSAQVIIALCSLGIELDDTRFVKNGKTALDALLNMASDDGGFAHIKGETESGIMATEQALCALVALIRYNSQKNHIYQMADVVKENIPTSTTPNKHSHITPPSLLYPEKTFEDIKGTPYAEAIEKLAARGVINGKSESAFDPDGSVTRAEFAAIISRGLGLEKAKENVFGDVSQTDWFYNYVNVAFEHGIIKGVSENTFNPNGKITKQEAAIMVTRAAALCGLNTDIGEPRDILAAFTDYTNVAHWAWDALAFCYYSSILPDDDMEIFALKEMTRGEIAQMLFNMFKEARIITED